MKKTERDIIFKSILAKQCAIKGLKKYEVACEIGMPKSTFYMKIGHPGRFTIDEMRDICRLLQFSVEDKTSII